MLFIALATLVACGGGPDDPEAALNSAIAGWSFASAWLVALVVVGALWRQRRLLGLRIAVIALALFVPTLLFTSRANDCAVFARNAMVGLCVAMIAAAGYVVVSRRRPL